MSRSLFFTSASPSRHLSLSRSLSLLPPSLPLPIPLCYPLPLLLCLARSLSPLPSSDVQSTAGTLYSSTLFLFHGVTITPSSLGLVRLLRPRGAYRSGGTTCLLVSIFLYLFFCKRRRNPFFSERRSVLVAYLQRVCVCVCVRSRVFPTPNS